MFSRPNNAKTCLLDSSPGGFAVVLTLIFGFFLSFTGDSRAQENHLSALPPESSTDVDIADGPLNEIPALVESAIDDGQMTGAVVLIGHRESIIFFEAFGHRQLEPSVERMTKDTVFDLASLTKPIATATSVMQLIEREQLSLDDTVSSLIEGFGQNGKESITLKQLLVHEGGLTPDNALADYQQGEEIAFERINALQTISTPGTKFAYSDVGFIVLAEVVRQVTGKRIDEYSQEQLFQKLQMKETGYLPTQALRERAATTEKRAGEWLKGHVHDPRAAALGGVAGHAGLFSTASDLAIYCQMLLNKGKFQGEQILRPETVDLMTRSFEVSRGTRGLGWDKESPYSSNRGETMSDSAFGHGGFTGTSLWIDPDRELYVIFLSNRLHPDGKGSVNKLAGRIGTLAVSAADAVSSDR